MQLHKSSSPMFVEIIQKLKCKPPHEFYNILATADSKWVLITNNSQILLDILKNEAWEPNLKKGIIYKGQTLPKFVYPEKYGCKYWPALSKMLLTLTSNLIVRMTSPLEIDVLCYANMKTIHAETKESQYTLPTYMYINHL